MKKAGVLFLLLCCSLLPAAQLGNYRVIAYYTGSGEAIQQFPVDKLTHIIYSFLKLQHDTLTFRNERQKENLVQLVKLKKQYPRLKIMVSIGGWGGCAPCSDLFASDEQRKTFAKTTVDLFRKYDVDGIDLDWEYPAIEGYPGHKYIPEDRDHFTELVRALRREMGTRYLISFAAGGFDDYLEQSVDWDAVSPLVDFVNLMTYDLVSGFSKMTGHHTPLMDNSHQQRTTDHCVTWLLNKNLPPQKLVIGAAFYARIWEHVADTLNGIYQPGTFKQSTPYRNFENYFKPGDGWKYYWDDEAKAPFRYNPNLKLFATFDDKRSIREKTAYVKNKKLGGIMFWELSQDTAADGLVQAISSGLR